MPSSNPGIAIRGRKSNRLATTHIGVGSSETDGKHKNTYRNKVSILEALFTPNPPKPRVMKTTTSTKREGIEGVHATSGSSAFMHSPQTLETLRLSQDLINSSKSLSRVEEKIDKLYQKYERQTQEQKLLQQR